MIAITRHSIVAVLLLLGSIPLTARGQQVRLDPSAFRSDAVWDKYGCRGEDPKFDNGPALSKILVEQGSTIDVAPVGRMATYYVASTIEWPARHGCALVGSGGYTFGMPIAQGCTRLVWNGPPGQPMIRYRGSGGRIERLILQGAPLNPTEKWRSTPPIASEGILVEARLSPPSGNLITDQVAFTWLETGIRCINEPDANHADLMTHYSPLFHRVRNPYVVDCDQSVVHTIYNMDVRTGYQTVFRFDRGGILNVYGCYLSRSRDATLLYLGKPTSTNGTYEISGLQVDGSVADLVLVSHSRYAHRVRISGAANKRRLAAMPVENREGRPSRFVNVKIDTTGLQWPPPKE